MPLMFADAEVMPHGREVRLKFWFIGTDLVPRPLPVMRPNPGASLASNSAPWRITRGGALLRTCWSVSAWERKPIPGKPYGMATPATSTGTPTQPNPDRDNVVLWVYLHVHGDDVIRATDLAANLKVDLAADAFKDLRSGTTKPRHPQRAHRW